MSGTPSTASIVLGSGDIDELEDRTEYLQRIEDSDTSSPPGSSRCATRCATS